MRSAFKACPRCGQPEGQVYCSTCHGPRVSEADRMAAVIRDWIHEAPLSRCAGLQPFQTDTCPDWPMAYELADKIVEALRA